MKISIKGNTEALTKKEMKYLLDFFAGILLGKRLSPNVELKVYVSDTLPTNLWGLCLPTDDDRKLPREFEIFLSSTISRKKSIKTLAHEMVHIKQFARGEFKVYDKGKYKWMGKQLFMTEQQYRKMPWEVEAHLSEKYLYDAYKVHMKNKEKEARNK